MQATEQKDALIAVLHIKGDMEAYYIVRVYKFYFPDLTTLVTPKYGKFDAGYIRNLISRSEAIVLFMVDKGPELDSMTYRELLEAMAQNKEIIMIAPMKIGIPKILKNYNKLKVLRPVKSQILEMLEKAFSKDASSIDLYVLKLQTDLLLKSLGMHLP